MHGKRGKAGEVMKDYKVEIVRRGTVLIRAASAEDAVAMAGQFGYHQAIRWKDNFDIHAEVALEATNRKARSDAGGRDGFGTQGGKSKRKAKKWKECQWESDIPF